MRANRLRLAVACFATLASIANADQPDETLPFFAPSQVFDTHGMDSLNLFNGDVNVTIPLGPSYTLGPTGFQWQMSASSSVKFWHFSTALCGGASRQFAWLEGDPTLGVGWALQLGYLVKRSTVSTWEYYSPDGGVHDTRSGITIDGSHLRTTASPNFSNPTSFTVEFPDGTIETFAHQYAAPRPTFGSSVDFNVLDYGEASQNRFGLSTIKDRFGNTLVTVNWSATPSEIASVTLNPLGSNVTFTWRDYAVNGVTWRVLDYLLFPAASSGQLKALFSYAPGTFARNDYDNTSGIVGCDSGLNVAAPELAGVTMSDPASSPPATRPSIIPFGYGFTYNSTSSGGVQKQGTLLMLTLPSLGTVLYDYDITAAIGCTVGPGCDPNGAGPAPAEPDHDPGIGDHTPGAISRTEHDPFTNRDSQTTYARTHFKGMTNGLLDRNKTFRRTTVIMPGNDEVGQAKYAQRYYFHVDNPNGDQNNANGIELDRRYYATNDPAQTAVRTIISCYIGQCGYQAGDGSIYEYDMPYNVNGGRVPSEASVTWYGATPVGQDGRVCTAGYAPACTKTDNTNYNATAGQYDTTAVTSTLPGSVSRMVDTNWTPGTAANHWLLDLFDHRFTWDGASLPVGVSDGQTAVRQYFAFDSTGFLKGSWTWDSVVDKVIMDCRYNGGGGIVSGEFSQTYSSSTEPTASNCPGGMPTVSADSDTFAKDHTWTNLLLTRSNWRSGMGTIGWNSFDVLRDASTGAITEQRDANYPTNSALKTSYAYDALGRVIMMQPRGGSSVEWPTTFCYLPGAGGFTPFVIVKKTGASPILNPNDPNGICKRDEGAPSTSSGSIEGYNYDGFGRLVREIRRSNHKFTGATYFAKRDTRYDMAGHRRILSDWQACPHDGTGQFSDTSVSACALPKVVAALDFPGHNLWLLNFDPFGRAQNLGNVDQANIGSDVFVDRGDGSISVSDSKEKTTTLCVNGVWAASTCTGAGQKNAESTIERDALGRVTKVTEPNPATGTLSTSDFTTYTYNVLDKLYQVKEFASGSSQTRTFQYLAFGFLKSETTPENGITGGDTASYSLYGSVGNLRTKTNPSPGGTQYNYSYDVAARLNLLTTGTSTPFTKYLVNCYDGTGVCGDASVSNYSPGGTYPKGRLTRRLGWNQMGFAATPVYDDFSYGASSGRLNFQTTSIGQRGTDLSKNGFGPPAIQSWVYNAQGLVSGHSHPRTAVSSTSITVNDSEVTSGLVTKVSAAWQGGGSLQIVTGNYHQSGRLSDYSTGVANPPSSRSTTTTIGADSVIPSRPLSYTAVNSSGATLFSTGSYKYDGDSDPMNIGLDGFTYDARSRLTQATYDGQPTAQGFSYDRYGNLTLKTGVNPVTLTTTAATNHLISSTYDERGNLTLFPTTGTQEALSYDLLNRQYRAIDYLASTDFSYIYDGAGERVGKFSSTGGAMRREFARVIIEARGDGSLSCTPGTSPFLDVACDSNVNDGKYIQKLKDTGITGGCGGGNYCPDLQTARDQASVFFLKGKWCAVPVTNCSYTPPPCTPPPNQRFADVPCPSQFADWVEELADETITVGCGNGNFCPATPLGSWQMLAWAQKIWPTYNPLPRATILTYRNENGQVTTEAQSAGLLGDASAAISYSKDNVFLGDLLVASATWTGTTPGWNFYSSDHLGTPRLTTDVSAAVAIETRKYWPYGDDGPMTGADTAQRIRFASMERDIEGKQYYDHARLHNFNLGRFVSSDPIGGHVENPQSWNRYSYGLGNPMKYTDPKGLISATVNACQNGKKCPQFEEVTVTATADAPPTETIDEGMQAFLAGSFARDLAQLLTGTVTLSCFKGYGLSVTVGHSHGQWSIHGRFGFGLGGGVEYDPNGTFPERFPGDTADRVFIGGSAQAGVAVGPVNVGYSGEVGGLFADNQWTPYESHGTTKSLSPELKGVKASASITPFEVGYAWPADTP